MFTVLGSNIVTWTFTRGPGGVAPDSLGAEISPLDAVGMFGEQQAMASYLCLLAEMALRLGAETSVHSQAPDLTVK